MSDAPSAPADLAWLDVGWIASDRCGQVALFTTGGRGPIPVAAMASVDAAEGAIMAMAERGPATSHLAGEPTGCFLDFARRGVFSCDWSDVHRVRAARIHAYELQASPGRPVLVGDLPEPVRQWAEAWRLDCVFGAGTVMPAGPFAP